MQIQGLGKSGSNKYLYNGKEHDDDTGWDDYGARMLDTQLGRWHTVDKKADDQNQIDKSPYAYAWNNPTTLTDPDGNCPWCAVGGALVEYGSQVAANVIENGLNKEALYQNIDVMDIAIAGLEAGLTGGASIIRRAGAKAAVKVAATVLTNAVDVKIENGGVKVTVKSAAETIVNSVVDVVGDGVANVALGKVTKNITGSSQKALQSSANKIKAKGGSSTTQRKSYAKATRSAANKTKGVDGVKSIGTDQAKDLVKKPVEDAYKKAATDYENFY